MTEVGVGVRLIPGGLTADKKYVQATVSLTPVAPSPLLGDKMDFTEWPSEIERLVSLAEGNGEAPFNIFIQLDAITPSTINRAKANSVGGRRAAEHKGGGGWRTTRVGDVSKITKWWSSLIRPAEISSWPSTDIYAQSKDVPKPPAAGAASPTDQAGKSPDAGGAPSVKSGGNADAALLMTLERARSLIERMSMPPTEGDHQHALLRKKESNLAYVPAETYDVTRPLPVWRGERPRLFALAGHSNTMIDNTLSSRSIEREHLDRLTHAQNDASSQVHADAIKDKCIMVRNLANAWKSTDAFNAAAAQDKNKISERIDCNLVQFKSLVSEPDPKQLDQSPKQPQKVNPVVQRLVALASQPVLARIFNLNIDILIDVTDLTKALNRSPAQFGMESLFAAISVDLNLHADRRNWTLIKLTFQDGKLLDVVPCTSAEAARCEPIHLSQSDGILALVGRGFEISSLDVVQSRANRNTHHDGLSEGSQTPATRLLTLRTAGLGLLYGNQTADATLQFGKTIASRDKADVLLDADDLTIGYRLDVATDETLDGHTRIWRTLCHRKVSFGFDTPLENDDLSKTMTVTAVDGILSRLIADQDMIDVYNSAHVVMPGRIVPDSADQNSAFSVQTEEIVAQWLGGPIGVDTEAKSVTIRECDVNNGALPLSQHIYLPSATDSNAHAIAPLRFGYGYRFGLTVKYQSGYSKKLNDFDSYDTTFGKQAILPPPEFPARRFLRQERIEAPLVTTPRHVLDRVFDGVPDGVRESAYRAVVRTVAMVDDHPQNSNSYLVSRRIVFPPSVSPTLAERHDVFGKNVVLSEFYAVDQNDRKKISKYTAPRDGIQNVNYDSDRTGGFPKRQPTSEVSEGSGAGGDAIFELRLKSKGPRFSPYYPDPAAQFLVIALRDKADRLLPGRPVIVPFEHDGMRYPDVAPVLIEVIADPSLTKSACDQSRIHLHATAGSTKPIPVYLDSEGTPLTSNKKDLVKASHVQVRLAPGEDVNLDLWTAPDEQCLLRWFDVVETTAVLLTDCTSDTTTNHCPNCETVVTSNGLNVDLKAFYHSMPDNERLIQGVGSKITRAGVIQSVASKVNDMLRTDSVPELSGRARIELIYPVLAPINAPASNLTLMRTAVNDAQGPNGDTVISVGGNVTVDGPSAGIISIEAVGPSLASSLMDDSQNKKRTSDQVLRGLWPTDPRTGRLKTPLDVYGFDVCADGKVTLPNQAVTLMKVSDAIQPPDSKESRWQRDLCDLQAQSAAAAQILANAKGENQIRDASINNIVIPQVTFPFVLKDSFARVVSTRTISSSHTAVYFRDARGDIISDQRTERTSDDQRIAIQSSKAPARVAPLTILPSFSLELGQGQGRNSANVVHTVTRHVKLRIRMQRPWFSSGAGERLGIVLWPPEIAATKPFAGRIDGTRNKVDRDYDISNMPFSGESPTIDMQAFRDEDLGPGGVFVTRWGADPIKRDEKNSGWLMPPEAFMDLSNAHVFGDTNLFLNPQWEPVMAGADDVECIYVPCVDMPIPEKEDAAPGTASNRIRLSVALLAYEPRFDIDTETWFVDISIDTGGMHEPFIRLGLVRFQPNAPADLRVSEPVTEWVQVLPKRQAQVSIDRKTSKKLEITVTGTGHFATEAVDASRAPSVAIWLERPLMRISVLCADNSGRETTALLDSGEPAEMNWIPKCLEEWETWLTAPKPSNVNGDEHKPKQHCAIRPETINGQLVWRTNFELQEAVRDKATDVRYSVFVEEVVAMRSATLQNEPVAADLSDDYLEISGPRFAARIPLLG